MPTILSSLEEGHTAIVSGLSGGRRFVSRVSAMGFTPDTPVTMMQNRGRGPVLVYLRDTQVALGRGAAAKIWIEGRAE
jgi:ferrous iron transport protein A